MKAANISRILSLLRRHYKTCRAPVAEFSKCGRGSPFQTLVATILSSRTLDQTTMAVCKKLFKVAPSAGDLRRISLPRLEKLVYPAGFYRVKARRLKALPGELDRLFGGRIPGSAEELMRLPGVGRKTANLVASRAFNRDEICVDVHVHRISNRLGLAHTKTPGDTETALKQVVPRKYWRDLNHLLVAFGQTVCRPRRPKCAVCPLGRYCPYPLTTPRPAARPLV